jgi:ubiquitin conjugation factor E4 B
MLFLVQSKSIASIIPDLPNWITPPSSPPSGQTIEQTSLLGHFFHLSPLAPGVPKEFFKDPKSISRGDKMSMGNNIQEAVRQYQDNLHKICTAIIKSGDKGRRGVLDWFAVVLGQNQKRRALQVDLATVATDGFMYNVVGVLNRFAAPFIDINGTKVSMLILQIQIRD